jgi:transcriptional regulator GlxA family with amidase domain
LRAHYPKVRVEAEPIFVRDGSIWSSAGVTAGIDLALALVAEDLGHTIALEVAQRLVVFLKRPGGHAQFSRTLAAQSNDRAGDFEALHAWMAENLAGDLRVERLAGRVGMSPRSFARLYAARAGTTPARAVEALRQEAARRMLTERPDLPVARVAERCGFGDDERMRRSFVRSLGVAPTDYRLRFGTAMDAVGAERGERSRW